jgi:hypothetical protein
MLACLLALQINSIKQADAQDGKFDAEFQAMQPKLDKLKPVCEELMLQGKSRASNEKILAAFPEASRTAAEAFMLGNLLFENDRAVSYKLHQAAVKAEPEDALVNFEWALQQHRAKEYAGALAAYKKYTDQRQQVQGMIHALQADCHLQLNQIDEAVKAWQASEAAPGTLEKMEEMVCAVNREPVPFARREELLAKVAEKKDAAAALELITLDCRWPHDWWNEVPHTRYLKHDLSVIGQTLKLPVNDLRWRTMNCAAECALAEGDVKKIKASLTEWQLLIDSAKTLPAPGNLRRMILEKANSAKVASLKDFAEPLLADARKSTDASDWHAALLASSPSDLAEHIKLEQEAWKATGDAAFMLGVLMLRDKQEPLKSDDPELVQAVKTFPLNGAIQRIALITAKRENKLTRELLAAAAKAEFHHFSSFMAPATIINRPRSNYLRAYFAELGRLK